MDHFGMGKSSGGSKVSTTSGPPQAFLNAYTDTYNQAKGLTQQPYQQYGGPMVAGFSPDQQAAFGTIQNSQGLAQPYFNQAASYMGSAATPISPMGFDNVASLPGMGGQYFDWAGQMAGQASAPISLMDYNISPYLSPYTENVTNSLSNTFAANNAEQYNQIRGNAAAQGAFGGDREAVAAAETARQQDLAQQQTLAGVSQQGFAQANQEFNAQQAADYQRQVAQKQYALASGQLGLGIGQGMWGEFNTQQQQDVAAQEASAYLQAQAGSGLANLGNLAQNSALSGAQAQMTAGGMQQQLEQQQLNVPYYQFMQQQAYPYQQAGWLANIAEGLGGASGGTGSTTYPGPSAISQIGGLATAGAGVYGLGKDQGWWGGGGSPSFSDFNNNLGSDWNPWAADGGAIKRAPGGGVGLGVPPEFGGAGIPGMSDSSYIPGASGMGTAPSSKSGGLLHSAFSQPVTTQSGGGGGGGDALGTAVNVGLKVLPFLLADGGVPRGTGLAHGYASGGEPHAAAPMVADLTHIAAPSSFAPPSMESLRPAQNFAPSFDANGYPGALQAVPHGSAVPGPLSIPMSNGMLNRAALNPVAAPMGLASAPATEAGPPAFVPFVDMGANTSGGGGASGGHVGRGGIGHYDGGGMVYPNLSQGYIPALQAAHQGMGPPKPPTMPGWRPDQGMSSQSITDMLKAVKGSGLLSESMGGAVMPSSMPLQYDDGGMVSPMAMGQPPVQQRALMQQFQGLPTEKLRELAMRYPAGTPQGSAIQRALQMRMSSPSSYPGGAGPAGPYGPQGDVQPGTTAANGGRMGLAAGGTYDLVAGDALDEDDAGSPGWVMRHLGDSPSGDTPEEAARRRTGEPNAGRRYYPDSGQASMGPTGGNMPGASLATEDILADHWRQGLTPVERSIKLMPSYGEGEVMPSYRSEQGAWAPESDAIRERQQNGGREDALLRALNAARQYQEDNPTWPRVNGLSDVVNWPTGSMARGGVTGRADGGTEESPWWMTDDYKRKLAELLKNVPPNVAGHILESEHYDEGSMMPNPNRSRGLDQEPVVPPSDRREAPLARALSDLWNHQDESPVFPRQSDANWPQGSLARGGLAGYADGGYPWEDYIEPPPKRPEDERPKVPPTHVGLAQGGFPDDVAYGPDADAIEIVGPPPVLASGLGKAPAATIADLPRPDIGDAGLGAPQDTVVAPSGGIVNGIQQPLSAEEYQRRYGPGREGGAPAAPLAAPQSADVDWQTAWPIIKHFESGNRNIPQGVVPAGGGYNPSVGRVTGPSTAQGFGQITNTNWRTLAPKLGIDLAQYPTAMTAPESLQEKVAHQLYLSDKARGGDGFGDWAPYNAKLAAFLGSGKSLPPQDQLVGPGTTPAAPAQGLASPPTDTASTAASRDKSPHTMRDIMTSPWMMLLATGAGMLASRSPYPGVALGEGLQTGLKLAGQGADRENKEELTQVRQASHEVQAKHFADMAEQARARANETSAHNATTEGLSAARIAASQDAASARLEMQRTQIAAQLAALDERNRHNAATEADKDRYRALQDQWRKTEEALKAPTKYENVYNPEAGTTGTYIVPRGAENDKSKWQFLPGGPKQTGEMTPTEYGREVTKAAMADPSYMADPEGAALRAKQALAALGIKPPAPPRAPAQPTAAAKPPVIEQNGHSYVLQPDGSYK